jgi:hypothetical protein
LTLTRAIGKSSSEPWPMAGVIKRSSEQLRRLDPEKTERFRTLPVGECQLSSRISKPFCPCHDMDGTCSKGSSTDQFERCFE